MIDTIPHWLNAMELIGQGWTKGRHARDDEGESVAPTSQAAVCWCLDGSMIKTSSASTTALYQQMAREADCTIMNLFPNLYGPYDEDTADVTEYNYIHWNDAEERTLEEVLDLLATIVEWKVILREEAEQTGRVFADYLKWPQE